MKTFTTYAEKKAKQFFNLLQGYTKGIRITAILILLLMGVSNVWGASVTPKGKYFYFKTSDTWKADGARFAVCFQWKEGGGQDDAWVSCTGVPNVPDMYYVQAPDKYWDMYFCRMNGGNQTNNWSNKWNQTSKLQYESPKNYWTKSTGWNENTTYSTYAPPMSSVTLENNGTSIVSGSGTNGDPYLVYVGTSIKVIASGTKAVNDPDATMYYDFKEGATSKQDGTSTTYSFTASSTVNTSYTINLDGYTKISSTSSTKTSATALYFKTIEKTYTVTINNDGHGTTTPSGAQSNVGEVTGLSIEANPAANYEFVNWTITSGSGSFGSETSASTTFKPTSAATIQANFRSTATNSLTVAAGAGIESVAGSTDPITLGSTYEIKATPKTGYTFRTWTANPVANATFGSATTANTTVTVKNGSVTVTASATENAHDVTVSYKYGDQTIQEDAIVTAVGEVTAKEITAPNIDGYVFTEWTLGDGITNKSANTTTNSINITTKASGEWTLTANYAKENCVYYINTNKWENVYVYAWNGGGEKKNADWPGEEMTKTDEKIGGFDVYKYCSPFDNLIFNNNSGAQTGDLVWEDGSYYEFGVHGNFSGEWKTTYFTSVSDNGTSVSLTLNINKGDNYEFGMKVPDWRSCNSISFTRNANSHSMTQNCGNDNNATFNADVTGEYTFTWTFATNTLTITYPTLSSYTIDFNMNGHGAAPESQTIEQGGKVTKPENPTAEGFTFGGWYTDAECTSPYDFNTQVSSSFTLYAKWIQQYVIVGSGNGTSGSQEMGNWLNGHSWIGDETVLRDNDNIINISKTYIDCPAGIKNFRIVPWGYTWSTDYGYEQLTDCNVPYYGNQDNNIVFVTIAKADITIGFDGTNITVNVEYDQEDLANVKNSIVTGENVMFYFGDEWSISDYKYVKDGAENVVTATKGFLLRNVGADKWLSVAVLPSKEYYIHNSVNGANTGEAVRAGAIYACYGNDESMGITPGVTPTWNNLTVSVPLETTASGLTATCGNSSVGLAQPITDYYYQLEGANTWTKFDPNNVNALSVGIYKVHALAYDGNIYVRTTEAATLTIYDEYTITYKDQGGSKFSGTHADGHPTTHTYGTETTLKTASKTGYSFDGWHTDAACTQKVTSLNATAYTTNITLYAKWTANTNTAYTVKHYKQLLNGDYSAIPDETENLTGTTDASVTPTVKSYTGFTAPSAQTVTIKADGSLVVTYKYARNKHTLSWNLDGGDITEAGTAAGEVAYGATLTAPTVQKDGHTFTGWSPAVPATMPDNDVTCTAQWTAKTYTVNFVQEGATTPGTNSTTVTYGQAMPAIELPTPADGYAFMGYWDGKDGSGTQYYYADGSSAHVWNKTDNATLYAHFVKVEITAITLDKSTFEPVEAGGEGYVTATPALEPTPTNDVIVCWKLLYNNGSEVAGHDAEVVSDRTVRFSIVGLAAGTYKIKATLRTGNDCESGEVLDTETVNFTIASNYTITVRYTCDGKEIQAASKVLAHVTEATEITAPDILGYTFEKWVLGDGVSSESTLTEKTIEFTAIYNGYLTAQYTKNTNIIYFYNTLGWENVYIYYYNGEYWDNSNGTGSKTGGTYQGYAQMTQIEGTNIWYVDANGKSTTYLVFGKEYQADKQYFDETSVARRGDYKNQLPMFVPVADQTPTMLYSGKTAYYNKGYWMNYPEFPGYTLDLFNHWEHNDPARYIMYPYSENTIFPLKIQVEINNENVVDGVHKIWFRIHRNDGKNLGDYTTSNSISYTDPEEFIGSANSTNKIEFRPNIAGVYTFILDYKDKGNNDYAYHIEVKYPTEAGDYRILYKDNTRNTYKPSDTKKIEEPNAITSFFIRPNNSPELKIQPALYVSNDDVSWSTTSNDQIHFKPRKNWELYDARFAAYFYNTSGNKWVDLTKNGDIYSCEKPSGYTHVIFCRMNPGMTENNFNNGTLWNKTSDLTIPTDGKNLYTMDSKIYLAPGSNWQGSSARFAAYFFDSDGNTWVDMTDSDGDGIYECELPADKLYSSVIFCRMNPGTTDNNFDSGTLWSKTKDLTLLSDESNKFTIPNNASTDNNTSQDGSWSSHGNTWSAVANGEIIDLSTELESKLEELQSQPDSVYTIYLSHSEGNFTIEKVVPYSGNFYIRCDVLGGGWEDYKTNPENRMTYSAFSESDANSFGDKYSHYATKYCDEGENIKFVIANDYSPCISDTLAKDVAVNGLDPFDNLDENGTIKSNNQQNKANVRFMWYRKTNRVSRVYIGSAAEPQRHFLVLKSNQEIKEQDGNDLQGDGDNHSEHKAVFEDTQNWIYERTIKVQPNTRVKLYACYPMDNISLDAAEQKAQHFRGAYDGDTWDEENSIVILGGSGTDWNTIRVIYDFKTNRLMAALVPDQEVSGEKTIAADVMIIRKHQDAATSITLTNDNSKLKEVKTVYGSLQLNRWVLNNRNSEKSGIEWCTKKVNNQDTYDENVTNEHHPVLSPGEQKSIYERALYFISFPFDVHLSDVFGFGTYGTHWVISDYNGLRRAQRGYFAEDCINEDCTNWDYIWDPSNFTLKANQGYLLSLDLDLMRYDNTDFWLHNIDQVELFFPSTANLATIEKTSYTMPALSEEYLCKINHNTDGTKPDRDRRVKDSYWRCIGVPSFADYDGSLKQDNEQGSDIVWKDNYEWKADESGFPFLYEWNVTDNSLSVQNTSAYQFKPTFAYLVQNGDAIYWKAVNTKPSTQIIARQRTEADRNYEWKIALLRNGNQEDQTFVRITDNENVTTAFDFNQDLAKEFNYGRGDIYTLIGYERVAANSMPCSDKTTIIPLGLNIEQAGDYTIAMPEGVENIGITLVDNETGIHTNLSAGQEYTLTLNNGICENRLFIEVSPIQNTPTDLEYTTGDTREQTTRKVLINEKLYIIRDGVVYDAQGHRL